MKNNKPVLFILPDIKSKKKERKRKKKSEDKIPKHENLISSYCCLMGIKLQFCNMKKFWRSVAQGECT